MSSRNFPQNITHTGRNSTNLPTILIPPVFFVSLCLCVSLPPIFSLDQILLFHFCEVSNFDRFSEIFFKHRPSASANMGYLAADSAYVSFPRHSLFVILRPVVPGLPFYFQSRSHLRKPNHPPERFRFRNARARRPNRSRRHRSAPQSNPLLLLRRFRSHRRRSGQRPSLQQPHTLRQFSEIPHDASFRK